MGSGLRRERGCTATSLLTACLSVSGSFAAPPTGALLLDQARIAVFSEADAAGLRERGLPAAGIAADMLTPWPVAGWSLAAAPRAARSLDGIETLVAAVAADPRIDFVSPVFVDDEGGPLIVTRDLLVGFHNGVSPQQAAAIVAQVDAGTVTDTDWAAMKGVYRLRSASHSGFDVLRAAADLAARPEVRFAEPDMIFTGQGSIYADDPGFANCWGVHNTGQFGGTPDMDMDGPEAWDTTIGNASIKVVILDCGVQQDHPDLNQVPGTDTTSEGPGDGSPVRACDDHGTLVAGCVSAVMNNGVGTVGIAPGCKVASARTFITLDECSGNWTSQSSWTVESLAWADSIGARVTGNSNIYGFTSAAIAAKYQETRAAGMVHFACAGNDASTQIAYPGSLPAVNAVNALDNLGELAFFATTGEGLAFSAPGQGIYTTDRTGTDGFSDEDYVYASGCSLATPYAAGLAALVLSVDPELSADQVELILQRTAADLGEPGYDTTYGWGFVNAFAAVGVADCVMFSDCDGDGTDDLCEIVHGTSADCNGNSTPDACELENGVAGDVDGNGVPDDCECVGDLNGNGYRDVPDLLDLLGHWGPCGTPPECPQDIIPDGIVGTPDLLYLLGNWGPCT